MIEQRKLRAETEKTASRIATVLNFITYNRLGGSEEQKILQDTTKQLSKLSREEMGLVIDHLEAALKAPNAATASKEQQEAYLKQKEVVDKLKVLLLQYDMIKSLDVAADRLEKASKSQLELKIATETTNQLIRDRRLSPRRGPAEDFQEQADGQFDLNRDASSIVTQLSRLERLASTPQRQAIPQAGTTAAFCSTRNTWTSAARCRTSASRLTNS